jgi:hypothetical protein
LIYVIEVLEFHLTQIREPELDKPNKIGVHSTSCKDVAEAIKRYSVRNTYRYIPNSCVKKIFGNDTWQGTRYFGPNGKEIGKYKNVPKW